ncbi:hypothetical protein [Arthrobacter rhizosphaerae]|uniref:hypothetical protein n=1 Tax=Arthrobacter rhizosphaerae TaxID=2855490 RepID=UPI001FF63D6E|nr:hypothetical protein [Arthrobacter rhizosphaerae]
MGIGDNIKKAAENAMKDLGGTADHVDDAHAPEPGQRDDDIQVHSSISEGSNAMDDETDDYPQHQGMSAGGFAEPGQSGPPQSGTDSSFPDTPEQPPPGTPPDRPETLPDDSPPLGNPDAPTGPAGLPNPDPEELRADPSEADGDPTSSMGRG